MDKEQFKKRIATLLEEGEKFTYDSLPRREGSKYPDVPPPELVTWIKRIEKTVEAICKADSAPYQVVRKGVLSVEIIKGNGSDVFNRVKSNLVQGLELALKALEDDFYGELIEPQAVEVPSMKVTREGVFFAGQYFDALQRVSEIFSQAKKSLSIIDGYIDERVLNILTSKAAAVEVSILTKSVSPALNTAAQTFNKQYGKLLIRTSSAFHDRFVIVDDTDFYHFGASIKDLGNRGFMFSLIEEPEVIDALRNKFTQEWTAATVVV